MPRPLILFGAFDRHNFGDLLFPHVLARMLGRGDVRFAGLLERDLRASGGHCVEAIASLAREFAGRKVDLVHVGGELLTCDRWEAAAMLCDPAQAQAAIRRCHADPAARLEWAERILGTRALAPYAAGGAWFADANVAYHAVGGVELAVREPNFRAELFARLRRAHTLSVRDRRTQALLAAAGIPCALVPDPAVMTAALFGPRIAARAEQGDTARMRRAFPAGYFAVQFNADFGDDRTLDAIAAGLEETMAASGCGAVFFRAGTAPWHDDLECYERLQPRLPPGRTALFRSTDIWDICALLAHSRLFFGTSLHGRIVAMSCGVPRLNLLRADAPCKQTAFAASWEPPGLPHAVTPDGIADGIRRALAADPAQLRQAALRLAAEYCGRFKVMTQTE